MYGSGKVMTMFSQHILNGLGHMYVFLPWMSDSAPHSCRHHAVWLSGCALCAVSPRRVTVRDV